MKFYSPFNLAKLLTSTPNQSLLCQAKPINYLLRKMPEFNSSELGLRFDMNACPNYCRHCYLGSPGSRRVSESDLRMIVNHFRTFIASKDNWTPIRCIVVSSWVWEPDYADNYRELYELELELSDGKPCRYELLSIWRLARDSQYAEWAKQIGPDTCQMTFFGMEETNDWFYRRKGAFQDLLKSTERLLEVGMKPRWQVFLTKKLIPDLSALLKLVDQLRLRERVEALGGEFVLFMHTPGPDGWARRIEHLRPRSEEVRNLPNEILESSRRHFGREKLWATERELLGQVLSQKGSVPYAYCVPERLWLIFKGNLDVYSNVATLEEPWKLGNAVTDSPADILRRFERNEPVGLKTIYSYSPRELAERFGHPEGEKIYSTGDDLLALYVAKHCDEITRRSSGHAEAACC